MLDILPPPRVDDVCLRDPVRRALDAHDLTIVTWQLDAIQPLTMASNSGIYRVSGTAADGGTTRDWSLILKLLCPPAKRESTTMSDFHDGDPATEPGSLHYWKREAMVYTSGMLDALPAGLGAPRCYGLHEPHADETWLWLEEVKDDSEPQWSFANYRQTARILGRFNGAYLVGEPIPRAPWLASDWLRRNLVRATTAIERLPEYFEHRVIRRWLPPDVLTMLRHIWEHRESLLDALDRVPQTFCHHDAHRFNLFVRGDASELVAIDWSASGVGPVGEDAGLLSGVTVLYELVELAQANELDETIFDGYLEGLQEAGWSGDPRVVRLGYAAEIALKIVIAYLPGMLWSMLDDSWYVAYEENSGNSIEVLADNQAERTRWLLDRGIEALELAGR